MNTCTLLLVRGDGGACCLDHLHEIIRQKNTRNIRQSAQECRLLQAMHQLPFGETSDDLIFLHMARESRLGIALLGKISSRT